jgi:hypothetical protein
MISQYAVAWPIVVSPAAVSSNGWIGVRPADERPLDTAVLIPETDLEVEDLLAMTLETEVPGLDDSGMDRSDPDLMNLRTLHPVEIDDPGDRGRRVRDPGPGHEGRLEPDRLQPWMPLRAQTALLGDLPLERLT